MSNAVIDKLFDRCFRYLQECVEDSNEEIDSERIDWQNQCFEGAILSHGRLMMPQHHKNTRQMDESNYFNGQCFSMSKQLSLSDSNLIYCEGYAFAEGMRSSTPLRHAWLIDQNGVVIDPTWATVGIWYYGVSFETDWVRNIWTNRAKNDPDYDCSIFQANYLEHQSILRDGIPQKAIVTF